MLTHYVPRFQVYLGKNRTNSDLFRQKGLGYYVVWTLGEPYLNNRHFFFKYNAKAAIGLKHLLNL